MYKTFAKITFICTGLLILLGIIGWFIPNDMFIPNRTFFELAHFSVLVVVAFLLFHLVQLKENKLAKED